MAIRCHQCGREYDVTLFQFGRTIHCACGARVGLEARVGPSVTHSDPRFMVDAMLGGLARWLRLLGFDAAYDPSIPDDELARRGLVEGRHILSRDRSFPEEWRVARCTILEYDDVEAQLKEVLERFHLKEKIRIFSRCPVCNILLEPLPKAEALDRVPPRVHEVYDTFASCPGCGRIYWEGSHTRRIRTRLKQILGD